MSTGVKISALPTTASLMSSDIFPLVTGGVTRRAAFSMLPFFPLGSGAVEMPLPDKLREIVSLTTFMSAAQKADAAARTGAVDCRAALAKATAFCKLTGVMLWTPPGNYLLNSDGGSITLQAVAIVGPGVQEGKSSPSLPTDKGAVFSITGTTNTPFKIQRGVTMRGLSFYYPNQTNSAAPTVYPDMLALDFTDGSVTYVHFDHNVVFNAYNFLSMDNGATGSFGHIWIEDNAIYAINRGLYLKYNAEYFHVDRNDWTFGIFTAATEAGLRLYTRANGIVFEVDKSDGFSFLGNLCYGYKYGLKCSVDPVVQASAIDNLFDNVLFPLFISGTGSWLNNVFALNRMKSFNSQDTTVIGNCVTVSSSVLSNVSLVGNYFGTTTGDHITVSGAAGHGVYLSGGEAEGMGYSQAAGSYAALKVDNGNAIIEIDGVSRVVGRGNAFTSGVIATSVSALGVSGVRFSSCFNAVKVAAATNVTLTGNASNTTGDTVSDSIAGVGSVVINGPDNLWDKASGSNTYYAFHAKKSASQTIGAGPTDIIFGTTELNSGGGFSTPTYTVPRAGKYRFQFLLSHGATGTVADVFQLVMTVNGTNRYLKQYTMIAANGNIDGTTPVLSLAATDAVKLTMTRPAGTGDFITLNDGNANFFSGELVQ